MTDSTTSSSVTQSSNVAIGTATMPHWRRVIGDDFTLYRTALDIISRYPEKAMSKWKTVQPLLDKLTWERVPLQKMKQDILDGIAHARNMSDSAVPLEFFNENIDRISLAGGARLTNDYLVTICGKCPKLEYLELRGCFYLSNDGLAAILKACTTLKYIGLQGCRKLTDSAIQLLCTLGNNLQGVDLGGCFNISASALYQLIKNHPNASKYETLHISGIDGLDDDLIPILAESMPSLRELSLGYFQGTDQGIADLVRGVPQLSVLNLHWALKLGNSSLSSIGMDARALEMLDVTGCHNMNSMGVQTLVSMRCTSVDDTSDDNGMKLRKLVAKFITLEGPLKQNIQERYPNLDLIN